MRSKQKVILWGAVVVFGLLAVFITSIFPERDPIPPHEQSGAVWDVYKDGRKVLEIKNEPGPLTSTALLPEGATPPQHPFLTAASRDPNEEDRLRTLLDRSQNFEEFLRLLRYEGYTVKKKR